MPTTEDIASHLYLVFAESLPFGVAAWEVPSCRGLIRSYRAG